MQNKTLSAGDPIESRCTKCRKLTNHTIVAMTDKGPARVACNTCKGEHQYRPPATRKQATARRTTEPKITPREEWEKLIAGIDTTLTKRYSMDGSFKTGSLIKHPQFGLGLVQRVIGNRKIEVFFADGKKTMRCK